MRRFAVAAAIAVAVSVAGGVTACGGDDDSDKDASSGGGTLTIAGFGGDYGAMEQERYFEPFTEETGIKVKFLPATPTLGALQVQADKGNVVWDLAEFAGPDVVLGCEDGLLAKVDYKVVDKQALGADAAYDCGVLAAGFVMGIGYDTTKIKDTPTWQDFLDVQKYPGKRSMEKFLQNGTYEHALLGSGVPKDDLYPLDVDRALEEMDALGDDLVLVDSLAQASQLLTSGDVVMAQTALNRMEPLMKAGLSVGFAPVGVRGPSIFAVPEGSPNKKEAMEFLAFLAECEECTVGIAEDQLMLGPNEAGRQSTPDELKKQLPTSPAVEASSVPLGIDWWADNNDKAQADFQKFLAGS